MLHISDEFRPVLERIGFRAEMIFSDSAIRPWRQLDDRENCVWDIAAGNRKIRLHVKRFPASRLGKSTAQIEAAGLAALERAKIPTARLAFWGALGDRRSFIAFEDLARFAPTDRWLEAGGEFETILIPTASLAVALHNADLHHRDLYLNHFLVRVGAGHKPDLRLIDAARVRKIPRLTRRRWIVKDLAQFWYSTLGQKISDVQRERWLGHYANEAGISEVAGLRRAIVKKSDWIAAHDRKLRTKQPGRNVPIPEM